MTHIPIEMKASLYLHALTLVALDIGRSVPIEHIMTV